MGETIEIRRNRPDYSQIFANMAPGLSKGMSAQNDIQSVLLPLLFKADLERKAKIDELTLTNQLENSKWEHRTNLAIEASKRAGLGIKLKSGEHGPDVEIMGPKETREEKVAGRSSKLGSVLPYLQKSGARNAPESVMREANVRYDTPEEQKMISASYQLGRKYAPKVSPPIKQTAQTIATASGAEEVLKEIGDLKEIIKNDPKEWYKNVPIVGSSSQASGVRIPGLAPYGRSQKGQVYRTLRESINNRLLYLRSGAQINDKEFKRLSGMLPELFRSDKVDLQQLERFENEFRSIAKKYGSKSDSLKSGTLSSGLTYTIE